MSTIWRVGLRDSPRVRSIRFGRVYPRAGWPPRGDLEPFADIRDAAMASIVQLHQNTELLHRKAGGFDKMTPAVHGPLHENIHEVMHAFGEWIGFSHS